MGTDADEKDIDSTVDNALKIASVVLWILGGALVVYALRFAGRPFGDVDDWGAFGDYIGGLVNPAVGVVTVLLIVMTLRVTRVEAHRTRKQMDEQLNLLSRQHVLSEMQRRLEGALVVWERYMDTKLGDVAVVQSNGMGLYLMTVPTYRQAFDYEPYAAQLKVTAASEHRDAAFRQWIMPFARLAILVCEISAYCDDYAREAGNNVVADFYRRRVHYAGSVLAAMGFMDRSVEESLRAPTVGFRPAKRASAPASPTPPSPSSVSE